LPLKVLFFFSEEQKNDYCYHRCGLLQDLPLPIIYLKKYKVTLFDLKGIGGGASGSSSGLLHPYPGEKGRRSWHADEALEATRELLQVAELELGKPVANYNGILKIGECLDPGEDVEQLSSDRFLIKSGITVFPELYFEGLWRACQKRGVELVLKNIKGLQELADFDQIVIAAGAGIRNFLNAAI
jgi:glycine/D-amino acid oxidase-like deaminating enzyme